MDPGINGVFPAGRLTGPTGTSRPQGSPGPTATEPTATGWPATGPGADFQRILRRQVDQERLKFSLHAQERLAGRGSLGPEELAKLSEAVDRASAKGARESLILMKDLALVVSVKNRTVITAVDGARIKDNVFTNIDSAVII